MTQKSALIVGAGKGISASLARLLTHEGYRVALAARNTDKLADLVAETGAQAYAVDAAEPEAVARLFEQVDTDLGVPELVVFNASARARGPVQDLDPAQVLESLRISAYAGFLVAQAAAVRMRLLGRGSILLTGATASVKGLAGSTPFAMGKFALRGMAQSLARELAPQNIHVAHFVIDGGVASSWSKPGEDGPEDKWLDPDAIAQEYLHIHNQHRSAWTWEVELRPWVEKF